MKRIHLIVSAFIAIVAIALFAHADVGQLTGAGGLKRVTHTSALTGDGTSTSPLGLANDLADCEDVGNLGGGNVYNDWEPTNWATKQCFKVRSGDHWGDILTGMDSTDIDVGDHRVIWNYVPQGWDAPLIISHFDSRSLEANRFWLPEENDILISPLSWVDFVYTYDPEYLRNVWTPVASSSVRHKHLIAQSLQVSAPLTIAEISGTIDDWDPDGDPVLSGPWCQAGNLCDGESSTAWSVYVDAAGATITGIEYAGIAEAAGQGPIKFLCNMGDGVLTLKHQNVGSDVANRITLPSEQDYQISACSNATNHDTSGCCVILYHNTQSAGWSLLSGSGPNDGTYPTVTGAQLNIGQYGSTPSVWAAGDNNDMDLGCGSGTSPGPKNSRVRVSPGVGSVLTGMVAAAPGDLCILESFASVSFTISDSDSDSLSANRIKTPGGETLIVPKFGTVECIYDQNGFWICGNQSGITAANSGTAITVANGLISMTAPGATCGAGEFLYLLTSYGAGLCTAETGDISSVVAGDGLINGGTSGAVTLDVACGDGLSCAANEVRMRQDCSTDDVLKWSGTDWTCEDSATFDSHVTYVGAEPGLSSCGTGTPTIDGNDMRGVITVDTGSPQQCTLTFDQEWTTNAPICVATIGTEGSIYAITKTVSTTAVTFKASSTLSAGEKFYYHCDGWLAP